MEYDYLNVCPRKSCSSQPKTKPPEHTHIVTSYGDNGNATSLDVLTFLKDRQIGRRRDNNPVPRGSEIFGPSVARCLPSLLQEKEYDLGKINKIFASAWVSDRQVVTGTKCNKLLVLDLLTRQMAEIPSLKSSHDSLPADCPCGIHSISINPSRTLLATGAKHTNDIAIYKLPTFDPLCVCENGHKDWIFDIKWLDDQFLVSGARDSSIALWKVTDDDQFGTQEYGSYSSPHVYERPLTTISCHNFAEKIRAIVHNEKLGHVACLTLDARMLIYDTKTWQLLDNKRLPFTRENVCLSQSTDSSLYAVGSQSHVAFIDSKTGKAVSNVPVKPRGCGVRSVSFQNGIVTVGTGAGSILFYDLNARKFLDCDCGHACTLNVGKGFLLRDEAFMDIFFDHDYPNAIYTHCYDESGTKLFAAGGPLPAGLHGNYCGLWS